MKEDLILIKDIRQGCFSDDPEIRAANTSGFLMEAGAHYSYNWNSGKGFYACGTHIIDEEDIDLDWFIEASKYDQLVLGVKKALYQLSKNLEL